MGRKGYLNKRIARLVKKKEDLVKRALASEDLEEVKKIKAKVEAIAEELVELTEELNDLIDAESDDEGADGDEGDEADPKDDTDDEKQGKTAKASRGAAYSGIVRATYMNGGAVAKREATVLDSMEYRQAFAQYVRTGDTAQFAAIDRRDDAVLTTTEVGKVIPNTIMEEFIHELKAYGNLYNRVRKINVRGGVEFPIEELVPTVSWITETAVSDTQAVPELSTSVMFGYYACEARIAQSLVSQVVSLPALETEIARVLAEAFIREFEYIIVNGTGSGQPTGILNDTRVLDDHKITMTESDAADWTKWRKNLFAKIPVAYRGQGVFVMTAGTWESEIMTLMDANNRPVYSETFDPLSGDTICRFGGREVILVEPDILQDFDSAASGDAFAVFFRPEDYAINSNLQVSFKRYFNDDTNKWVNKGIAIVDGKLLDVNGAFVLYKGAKS